MTTLSIENLPASTTSASLLAMFSDFGATNASAQIRDDGHGPQVFGCVVIPDIFLALEAVSVMNNRQTPGRAPLSVSIKN